MVPPSVYTPDLPYSLEQIILKCTQKSVDRRYSRMEDVIADLKHSLIDPQGDFVRLTTVDNDAKTVVISEEELGEIKHTPKQITKPEITALEEEKYDDNDYDDAEEEYRPRSEHRSGKKKKHHGSGRGLTIAALIGGAVLLIVLVVVLGRAAGLFGTGSSGAADSSKAEAKQESAADGLATVPDLVGKTEEEAKTLANDAHLGVQMAGEEASDQEKGRISRQETAVGTQVEANTTVKYWVSTGTAQVTIPDLDGRTGIDAQQTLEDMGLTVEIQKEYSELNDDGTPVTDPGYAVSTTPTAGNSVSAGDSVTLLVSRGVDYGDSVEVPSVVGMTKNDAVTTFGKFLNVEVKEEKSTEVAEGEVISQEPEAGNWEDPDNVNVVITVSTGDQEPSAQSDSADTAASSDAPAQTADNSAAAAAGEVWKCTQTLNTPSGYSGGPVRLELIQNVNGTPTASVVLEDQVIQFPYDLDITGAPGISEGTLYLSEQINGTYQELGNYSITFAKAE